MLFRGPPHCCRLLVFFALSAPRTDQARMNLIIAPKPEVDEPLPLAIAAAYRRAAVIRAIKALETGEQARVIAMKRLVN